MKRQFRAKVLRRNVFAPITWLSAIACLAAFALNKPEKATARQQQDPPTQQTATRLDLNSQVGSTLKGRETHVYQVQMATGQYARISIKPQIGELKAELVSPDGKKLLEVYGETGTTEGAVVSIVADQLGFYTVNVFASSPTTGEIDYSAELIGLREATQVDKDRTRAEWYFAKAELLRRSKENVDWVQAVSDYRISMGYWRAALDKRGEADAFSTMGWVLYRLGDYEQALEAYDAAIMLSKQVQAMRIEADTLNNIGVLHRTQGNYQQAIYYYGQALPAMRQIAHQKGEATILNNIAAVYRLVGQPQEALKFFDEVLQIRIKQRDRIGEALTLNGKGLAYADLKQHERAIELYKEAATILRGEEATASTSLANVLNNWGNSCSQLSEYDEALRLHQEAHSLLEGRDKRSAAFAKNSIASILEIQGHQEEALTLRQAALKTSVELKDSNLEMITLYGLARHERDAGRLLDAVAHIQKAIKSSESVRANLASFELRMSYFASRRRYYEFYVDLLMRIGQQPEQSDYKFSALQISEQARARVLLDLLNGIQSDLAPKIAPHLANQELDLKNRIEEKTIALTRLLLKKRLAAQELKVKELEKDISQLNVQLVLLRGKIKEDTQLKLKEMASASSLTLKEVQQGIVAPNTLLLEFMLGEERSYLFAITSSSFESYELPPRADIERLANKFIGWFKGKFDDPEKFSKKVASSSQFLKECLPGASKLSQILLGQVQEQLKGKDKLVLVNDGILHYLPYAALPSITATTAKAQIGYAPLILDYELSSVPSASVLRLIREKTVNRPLPDKMIAIFADPVFESNDDRLPARKKNPTSSGLISSEEATESLTQKARQKISELNAEDPFGRLPYTRREALNIQKLFPLKESKVALGFEASRARVKTEDFRQYQFIHFATHGYLIEQQPGLSGLVLSLLDKKGKGQDGYLRLADIFSMKMPAELVVLSACHTGLGKMVEGEGVMGMTSGFINAGAKRVVVSLWGVSDQSTSVLMSHFYETVLKQNASPASALRRAQIKLIESSQWNSPYYWAGFMLQGEPL